MKIKFTNLYKLLSDKSKIINKINTLIKQSQFVGGEEVENFEKNFRKFVKAKYCVSVGNGTDALEIAVASLKLKKILRLFCLLILGYPLLSQLLAMIASQYSVILIYMTTQYV